MSVSCVRAVSVFFIGALLFIGCGRGEVRTAETPGVPKADAEKSQADVPEDVPEDAVAMVGEDPITKADLEVTLKEVPKRRRQAVRMRTIYYLVETKIFSNEAKEKGLDKDPEVQKEMARKRDETLARAYVSQYIEPETKPSEEEIKEYYDENKDLFVIPEGVRVRQIRCVKKEDAQNALDAIEGGMTFEEAARKWSKLVRFKDRGKPDWLYKNRIAPNLQEAAFTLTEGDISGVVETGEDYRILKVLDTSKERLVEFEQVKAKIRFRLRQQNKRQLLHDYYEKAGVDRDPGEGLLVKIGDRKIKAEAISDILSKVERDKKREDLKRRWQKYFIETTVFSEAAREVGLQDDPEISHKIKLLQEDVLADAYRKKYVADKIRVTDDEITEEYEANLETFYKPARLRLRLIVVETREEAEELLARIEDGTAFSLLARQHSIHPSSERGGELGWFSKGDKGAAIEAAAMKLDKYEVSDIIKTDRGYELVKLMDDIREGGPEPLENVKPRIKMVLQTKKRQKVKDPYYEKWNIRILETAKDMDIPMGGLKMGPRKGEPSSKENPVAGENKASDS